MTYSYNVEYSEEAYEDLREIYDYVANELLVPKTAENLLKIIVYYLVEENKRKVSIVRIFYNGRDISKIINSKT